MGIANRTIQEIDASITLAQTSTVIARNLVVPPRHHSWTPVAGRSCERE